jgi:hypothetical protein
MFASKFLRYTLAVLLFGFYAYIAFNSGVMAAIVVFLKILGLVIFGMAHVWVVDTLQVLGSIIRRIKWSSTSLLGFLRRSQ